MPKPRSSGAVLSKENAIGDVSKLLDGQKCPFRMVKFLDFKKSFQGSPLRSTAYEKFLVLCHEKSYYHAGWLVCPCTETEVKNDLG